MTDDQILTAILRREGGYVHHPDDRGGCTNWGITLQTLKDWRKADVTCADVQAMTVDEAKAIYRARYIAPFDGLEPAIKGQVVDMAVNHGAFRARTLLADAERNKGQRSLSTQLVIERLKFYAGIVRKNPRQSVFLPGWVNRAVEFL